MICPIGLVMFLENGKEGFMQMRIFLLVLIGAMGLAIGTNGSLSLPAEDRQ